MNSSQTTTARPRRIAVAGVPNAGKSVLLAALLGAMPGRASIVRANPDGDTVLFSESGDGAARRPKGAFTAAFVAAVVARLALAAKGTGVTLVDLGGRRSAETAAILAECDAAILLDRADSAEGDAWAAFIAAAGLPLVARIVSAWDEGADEIVVGPTITGTIRRLARGAIARCRPSIRILAAALAAL